MAQAGIKEVARRAGVSLGTVSNVLNRPQAVAPQTRQRVLDAIKELGYVRNDSARHLRAGRSRTVAIVVLDVSNPFFTDVVRGAEEAVEQAGGMLVVCNSGEDPARESHHLDLLEEQRVRGLLITPVSGGPHAQLERLIERGIPVVLVDRGSGQPNRCSVAVDDVLGGRLAAQHLAELGHRKITFVGGPFTITQVAERHAGAAAALAEHEAATASAKREAGGAGSVEREGGAVSPADRRGGGSAALADRDGGGFELRVVETRSLSATAGREAAEGICALPAALRPTAIFCANDLLALGVLQGLTTGGLRVPQDIALVGYDDIDFAATAAVPLTSVRQPRELLGRTAAHLLLEEAEAGVRHGHRHVVFQPDLVVRQSTSPQAGRGSGG